jgi:hypothetical protein
MAMRTFNPVSEYNSYKITKIARRRPGRKTVFQRVARFLVNA